MRFNDHSRLADQHAIISPSKYHWLRYDLDKFDRHLDTIFASLRGSELHQIANMLIRRGIKLPDTTATLNQYVNDAIGFGMSPEQVVFYSANCFGTADAIRYDELKKFLRIHDLKTGVTAASMDQLIAYAAIFCLEYGLNPFDIVMELRIYQNDQVVTMLADSDYVFHGMEQIKIFDRRINERREEEM